MRREPGAADLVLVGGSVVTMDGARTAATAVAVRDGRIVAVGSTATWPPSSGQAPGESTSPGARSCPASRTPTAIRRWPG